jgi:hypothetical protein
MPSCFEFNIRLLVGDVPAAFDFDFASRGLPKISELFGRSISERFLHQGPLFRECFADIDAEDLFVLPNCSLVVNEDQDTPAEQATEMQHPNGAFYIWIIPLDIRLKILV